MQGLKRMRLAAGLSLRELGSRLGVSAQAVHKWETGVAWPSAYLLPQIAEALDCSIAELYAEEPEASGGAEGPGDPSAAPRDDREKAPRDDEAAEGPGDPSAAPRDDKNNYTEEDRI